MPSIREKSIKQIRYLLSEGSPLSPAQKIKLRTELKNKQVKVKKK